MNSAMHSEFGREFLSALRSESRRISPKFLYDEHGSRLFEKICDLPEYYLTRAEIEILRERAGEIAELAGDRCVMIELGSGEGIKTRIVLDHLRSPSAYVPVEISPSALEASCAELARRYPEIAIHPVCADFMKPIELPEIGAQENARKMGFFPGSTIGNLEPVEAERFLSRMGRMLGQGGLMLLGFDPAKSPELIEPAYNDSQGVTAAFNINLLERARRELMLPVDPDCFYHRAIFNPRESRIEMHLISRRDQEIQFGDETFRIREGETFHTENSYKYDPEFFAGMAERAGFRVLRDWTDSRGLFRVMMLERTRDNPSSKKAAPPCR